MPPSGDRRLSQAARDEGTRRETMPRSAPAGGLGQGLSDSFNLLLCAGSPVAVAGGVGVLIALPAFLLSALRGHMDGWVQLLLISLISAVILRAATVSRDPTARAEDAVMRQARAFCFVPEALLGWATLGKSCAGASAPAAPPAAPAQCRPSPASHLSCLAPLPPHACAVPVLELEGHTLLVGSLPSPALVRTFARENGVSRDVLVLNVCRFFRGYETQYAELGLEQLLMPPGSIYIPDAVDEIRRRRASPDKSQTRPQPNPTQPKPRLKPSPHPHPHSSSYPQPIRCQARGAARGAAARALRALRERRGGDGRGGGGPSGDGLGRRPRRRR